jgi:hypothetical protein
LEEEEGRTVMTWEVLILENLEVMGAGILQTSDGGGLRKPSTDGNGHGRA